MLASLSEIHNTGLGNRCASAAIGVEDVESGGGHQAGAGLTSNSRTTGKDPEFESAATRGGASRPACIGELRNG